MTELGVASKASPASDGNRNQTGVLTPAEEAEPPAIGVLEVHRLPRVPAADQVVPAVSVFRKPAL